MNEQIIDNKLVEEYWYRKLSNASFPGAFFNVAGNGLQRETITELLPGEVVNTLSRLSNGNPLGGYAICLALFAFVTGKYFRESKLLVSSPAVRNTGNAVTPVMPLFFRLPAYHGLLLGDYIRKVSAEVQESIAHATVSYSDLRMRFTDRNIDEDLLHTIGFYYAPVQQDREGLANAKWLLLLEPDAGGQMQMQLQFDPSVIERTLAADFLSRYGKLLQQLEQQFLLKMPFDKIELLETAERDQIFFTFNNESTPVPEGSLTALFEQQVQAHPDIIAIRYQDEELTYLQLNTMANRLAFQLNNNGVGNGAIVGVLLDRSLDIGTAVLGILKAGAAFLMIDPLFPVTRISAILDDAQPAMVITRSEYLELLEGYEGNVFATDIQLQLLDGPAHDPAPAATADSLAYVLYTSGTTGVPKGAMISHGAMVNLVNGLRATYLPGQPSMQMAVVAASVFDPFWKQFFLSLLEGHTLHIIPEKVKQHARALWSYYSRHNITLTDGTPSLLNILVNELPSANVPLQVQYFMIGGERLQVPPLKKLYRYFSERQQLVSVINEYGVTECCVDNICCLVDPDTLSEDAPVPIGKPLPNNQVLILDADNRLVPLGCYGQIGILGKGVGQGYLNRPELTAGKFIDCPYNGFSGKVYLTGDLGKWLPDGSIVCSGRLDNQVKVNGYRIELEEVEAAMYKIAGVKEAVAVIRDQDNKKALVVYWTGSPQLNAAFIKEALLKYLPAYILPSGYCRLEQIPLTINGKVNKQALPDPWAAGNSGEVYKHPETPVQQMLLDIWKKVLGITEIGIRSDFFLNGGDSIKAIQISSQLHGLGYQMEIRDIFQYPTVEQLAPVIKKQEHVPDQEMITGELPLTPVQQEFFVVQGGNSHYNQSVLLKFRKRLAPQKITEILTVLQAHHDALRIVFRKQDNGSWLQLNRDTAQLPELHVFDWPEEEAGSERFLAAANGLQKSMDLEKGPLFKAGLFQTSAGSHLLLIAHHLVMDAVSFRILLEDLSTLDAQYDNGQPLQLPPKTDAYKLWAGRLLQYAGSNRLLREWNYWQQQTAAIAALKHPEIINASPAPVSGHCSFELEPAVIQLLSAAHRSFNTETQDLLLAAVIMGYKEVWEKDRLAVILEGHGREPVAGDVNVTRTVGWFTSLYPVYFNVTEAAGLEDHIITVKETLRAVPGKGMGYGIIKYLVPEEFKQHIQLNITVPLVFNYLGQVNTAANSGAFHLADEPHGREQHSDTTAAGMEITAVITDGKLYMGLTYRQVHAPADVVETFWNNVQTRLQELILFASSRQEVTRSPADFTYKKLTRQQLGSMLQQYHVQDIYPLSPMQEGMLFSALYKQSSAYMEQLSYRVKSTRLDPALVKRSVEELVRRHEILRTVFLSANLDKPLQVVLKEQPVSCLFRDLREQQDPDADIQQFKKTDQQHLFDLDRDVLLRVAIFQLEDDVYEFVWTHHHILMDAWCEGVLIKEYYSIYNALLKGQPVELPAPPPYSTYIRWLEEQDTDSAKNYWRQYLSGFEKTTAFPGRIFQNSGEQPGGKATSELRLNSAVTAAIATLAATCQVTVNTVIQSVWAILLSRYNNTSDVVFGNVVSGRPSAIPGVDNMVGLFINTIPVRVQLQRESRFAGLLEQVQLHALESEPFQYESLSEIQSLSGHHPLLDHIILFDNYPSAEEQLDRDQPSLEVGLSDIYDIRFFEEPHYDFNIRVIPGKELTIRFDYKPATCTTTVVKRVQAQLQQLINSVLTDPQVLIRDLDITVQEEKAYLQQWGAGQSVTSNVDTVTTWLEVWAIQQPHKPALQYQDKILTYNELYRQVSSLAALLEVQYHVGPGQVVGVMMERTDLVMIAILGILHTGAAFLPVDVALPDERKAFLLKDAGIQLLLTTTDHTPALEQYYEEVTLAMDLPIMDNGQLLPAPVLQEQDQLAYILYTSGSTGLPKGVKVRMSGLMNYLKWANEYYFGNNTGHCFGLITSLSFDLSLTALFSGLLRGDKVVIFDTRGAIIDQLAYLFEDQDEVNALKITPSHVDLLAQLSPGKCAIETVILGGEQIRASHIKLLQSLNPAMRIYNEYGPTEATIGSTIKEITTPGEIWSIGRPVYNTRIHILNDDLKLQPIMAIGEIFIGGAGVAIGYLNREELTHQRFVNVKGTGNEILYRTGDVGMWTEEGEIRYLGRTDEQLKIRGHRIEPAEIEKATEAIPGVSIAVVKAFPDKNGEQELVVYYTSNNATPLHDIREQLMKTLPVYMLPACFIHLEEMPLNTNGKINRRDLPAPVWDDHTAKASLLPVNEAEIQLLQLWQEVLGKEHISMDDNFFAAGGNSLKIARLYELIRRTTGNRVMISALFDNPTIRRQAAIIGADITTPQGNAPVVTVIDF